MGSREEGFSVANARAQFPALSQHQVYFDNAGGSQTLASVVHSITQYLLETNVQLGASYKIAKQSTQSFANGLTAAAAFINADVDEIVLGGSTTQLFANLAQALSIPHSSEIIISSLDHEANIASWLRLAKAKDLTVKWWTPPSATSDPVLTPENLRPLLSEKTKFVACTHTSNVLGTIHNIKAIADTVHEVPGAMLCVDGVAYAPHRKVDVKALGIDFYAFSWYKVYGPHISLLYASHRTQEYLQSLGHYFHPTNTLSSKLGLAASSYELVASIPSVLSYFGPDPESLWSSIAAHEEKLQAILLDYLRGRSDITIYGKKEAGAEVRVPVISFVVTGKGSKAVVEGIEKRSDYGCRWGHFYSKRLVEEFLGLSEEGVVRVSLVHYNTEEEVSGFVRVIDEVLSEH